ncbi:MAG: hypothetical protein ACREAB_00875 [Blastocatellia bacterium]
MKKTLFLSVAIIICSALIFTSGAAQINGQSKDARAAVNKFFSLLKSRSYPALYEFLPSDLQRQITREQLSFSLKRLESFILIEKMEISRVQERGDYAIADTTIYGKLIKPMKINNEEISEGRILAQQYLLKENGQWKIASADGRMLNHFLKRNPDFNKQFQFNQPKFEFKQNGEWKLVGRRQ